MALLTCVLNFQPLSLPVRFTTHLGLLKWPLGSSFGKLKQSYIKFIGLLVKSHMLTFPTIQFQFLSWRKTADIHVIN